MRLKVKYVSHQNCRKDIVDGSCSSNDASFRYSEYIFRKILRFLPVMVVAYFHQGKELITIFRRRTPVTVERRANEIVHSMDDGVFYGMSAPCSLHCQCPGSHLRSHLCAALMDFCASSCADLAVASVRGNAIFRHSSNVSTESKFVKV